MNRTSNHRQKTASTSASIAIAVSMALASSTAFAGPPCDQVADGSHDRPVPPQCEAQHESLKKLRDASSAFFSYEVGTAAGWNVPLSECVESPMGGMGYHIANMDRLLDGGALSLLHPEVLLYVPTEDGSMEFVGVEYIIPAADWTEPTAPEFLGKHMHYNPVQDIWALHVWVGADNPNGIFEDWNPTVSCAFAE